MVQLLFAVGLLLHTAEITLNLPFGKATSPVDAKGQEMQRGQGATLNSGIILMGHGESRAWGDALAGDGGASASISLRAVLVQALVQFY